MNQEMLRIIDSIARDRNVDKESLFRDIEQAMVSAARKHFNAEDTDEFTSTVDRLTGQIRIFRGAEEIPMSSLGRIPAQTAKQVMIQKFREDEHASIYGEFESRVGELVTGTAQRYEGGALVISLGRAEGFMPRSEQIPGEQHQPGERIRCLILDVRDEGSQVKIVLSRAHPDFIRRLFEVEVPEVLERIIEIKALAREPGHRTKVAVSSIDSKVDAVGACVGVRGSRIKNIVDELGGEKIDVVRWNESSQVLIANALRPAEIVEISLCFELGRATVVVNEDQLSLAIGKRGQNVRLAARLTGWDVDILTPTEFQKGLDILEETVKTVSGVTEEMVDRMAALGLITVFDVEEVGTDVLMEHLRDLGLTDEMAEQMLTACSERGKIVAEQQQKDREEAERRKAEEAQGIIRGQTGEAGDDRAAAILGGVFGGGASAAAAGDSSAGSTEGGDVLDMLLSGRINSDEERDVNLAKEAGEAQRRPEPKSPAEEDIEHAQDEVETSRLAQGSDSAPAASEQNNDQNL
jgi:N utilization substance protein A